MGGELATYFLSPVFSLIQSALKHISTWLSHTCSFLTQFWNNYSTCFVLEFSFIQFYAFVCKCFRKPCFIALLILSFFLFKAMINFKHSEKEKNFHKTFGEFIASHFLSLLSIDLVEFFVLICLSNSEAREQRKMPTQKVKLVIANRNECRKFMWFDDEFAVFMTCTCEHCGGL